MSTRTREDLITLLDRSLSMLQEPGLYSSEEQYDLLDDLQEAIDAEQTNVNTWE